LPKKTEVDQLYVLPRSQPVEVDIKAEITTSHRIETPSAPIRFELGQPRVVWDIADLSLYEDALTTTGIINMPPPEEEISYYHAPVGLRRGLVNLTDGIEFQTEARRQEIREWMQDDFDPEIWASLWRNHPVLMNNLTSAAYFSGNESNREEIMNRYIWASTLDPFERSFLLSWSRHVRNQNIPNFNDNDQAVLQDFLEHYNPEDLLEVGRTMVVQRTNHNHDLEILASCPATIVEDREKDNIWNFLWQQYPHFMDNILMLMNNHHVSPNYSELFRDVTYYTEQLGEVSMRVVWEWVSFYMMIPENLQAGAITMADMQGTTGLLNFIEATGHTGGMASGVGMTDMSTAEGMTGNARGGLLDFVRMRHREGWVSGDGPNNQLVQQEVADPMVDIKATRKATKNQEYIIWENLWFGHAEMMQTIQYILDDCTTDYKERDESKRMIKLNFDMKPRIKAVLDSMTTSLLNIESSFIWKWVNELIEFASEKKKPIPFRQLGPGIKEGKQHTKAIKKRKERPYIALTPRPK
jgi:hypothetical protein